MIPPFTPSGMLHSQLPNTAFSIVEEIYSKLPALMNLRDMLYALDKNPDFYSNKFTATDYYAVTFTDEFIDSYGYAATDKDMQILATHIEGDDSYTRFFFKDLLETPSGNLINAFILPKTRSISKFTVYSKDRTSSTTISVSTDNVYTVSTSAVTSTSLNTPQSLLEILPAWNSTQVTGGSSGGGSSLWTSANSATFIPIYIAFDNTSTFRLNLDIAREMHLNGAPLQYVSTDTNYMYFAAPIPFVQSNAGTPGFYIDDLLLEYKGFIATGSDNSNVFIPGGAAYISPDHNNLSTVPNVYALRLDPNIQSYSFYVANSANSTILGITADNENYFPRVVADTGSNHFTFIDEWQNLTPVTFNAIKPKNNKLTYLGN